MSEERRELEAPARAATVRRIERRVPRQSDDACCAPEPPSPRLRAVLRSAGGGDACCAPDPGAEQASDREDADAEEEIRPPWWRDRALLPSAVSGVFLLAGYVCEWSGLSTPALVLFALALLAGALTFAPGAIRRVLRGRLGVGLLMTIAAIGAVLLGHVGEAAALAFLFSLAEALEDRSMDRAREGLRALLSLIPETVRLSKIHGDVIVPAADVREFDVLVVGAGERIPTDGVVIDGRSSLDTSAVTGESIPVAVGPGSVVVAGSVNGAATVQIEATADGRDNSLTRIVALVEQAQARKGTRARLADRIARPLVPAVLVVAVLVAAFGIVIGEPGVWIERALVVLVAASPCALAIAVPVTVISAIGAAAKFGVVITSGLAFEQLGTIRTVALDKTGTLTRNRPEVIDVRPLSASSEDVLAWAAAVERTSTHPLASAVVASATHALPAQEIVEEAGRGVTGLVDGRRIRVGSLRWLDAARADGSAERAANAMSAQGMTVVAVEADGTLAGIIGVRDELRPESAETVRMLHDAGMTTIMLTGDNGRTARALADAVGIHEVRAGQLPVDKARVIAELSASAPTAMVGDGINDAPALATATVGIALGTAGSAAAIESADVAFTGHDLRLIPAALAHARRGRRIMAVNIGLALAIIVVLFPLALFGVLGLAGVVLVHEVAEVIVILNGVRAARRPAAAREATASARS